MRTDKSKCFEAYILKYLICMIFRPGPQQSYFREPVEL